MPSLDYVNNVNDAIAIVMEVVRDDGGDGMAAREQDDGAAALPRAPKMA